MDPTATVPAPLPDRNRLRSLGLKTSRKAGFDAELIAFVIDPATGVLRLPHDAGDEGLERIAYELRSPSIKKRGTIMQAAMSDAAAEPGTMKLDIARLQLAALLECVFVPLTGPNGEATCGGTDRVFAPTDLTELGEAPVGSHLDVLAKKAQALVTLDAEEVGKA